MSNSSLYFTGKNDLERQNANDKFLALLEPVLDQEKSMKYSFDSLSTISILSSKDKKVRIINWVIQKDNGLLITKLLYSFTIIKTNTRLPTLNPYKRNFVKLKK